MNLRYVVTASPNNVVVERSSLDRPCEDNYRMQLEQVTVNAVEKALRYQVGSQRLVNNLPVNASKIATPRTQRLRDWSLDTDSEDRRHVAAKIYALLVQWKSDFSFEWRAKVAAAVHVFEEAMYQQAKSKNEYTNPSLLELQLTQVLWHFERGNGGCLLEGKIPLNSFQEFSFPRSVSHLITSERLDDTRAINENGSEEMEAQDVNGTQESGGSLLAPEMRFSTKEVANNALWEAILQGHKRALEENHHKLKEQATIKRRVERVVNLISKRKRKDEKRLKHELQKAMADNNPERLATMLASAKLAYSNELKDLCNAAEVMLVKLLEAAGASSSGEDDRPRKRKGKSLRERLRLDCAISEGETKDIFPQNSTNLDSERSEGTSCSCGNDTELSIHVPCTELGRQDLNSDLQEHQVTAAGGETEMQNQMAYSSLSSRIEDLVIVENLVEISDPVAAVAEVHAEGEEETREEIIVEQLRGRHKYVCLPSTDDSEISVVADLRREASLEETNGQGEAFIIQIPEQTQEVTPQVREVVEEQITQTVYEAGDSGASPASAARGVSNRVSLMRLLAEGHEENSELTNQYTSGTCPSYSLAPSETWEEPTEHLDPVCCVCMAGLKGAALVPCGHTFCRRCSRELWRGRGTCPLCNRFIREILDIY